MTTEELSKLVDKKNSPIIINKGIGSLSLLGVALVVLKAMGYINWSWWLILAPFYIPIICIVAVLMGTLYVVYKICNKMEIEAQKIEKQASKTHKKKSKKSDSNEGGENKETKEKNG